MSDQEIKRRRYRRPYSAKEFEEHLDRTHDRIVGEEDRVWIRLSVKCSGKSGMPHKNIEVGRLIKLPRHSRRFTYLREVLGRHDPLEIRNESQSVWWSFETTELVDNEPADGGQGTVHKLASLDPWTQHVAPDIRIRYVFECRICHCRVTSNVEKLEPRLDDLIRVGAECVELSVLHRLLDPQESASRQRK